jgi:hypothetical protein
MALQLGGGGYRPSGTVDPLSAQKAQAEAKAAQLTQSMQQQAFAWKAEDRRTDKQNAQAKSRMYDYFMVRSNSYKDLNNLGESMVNNPQNFQDIESIRGFSDKAKQRAFNAYKSSAAQPDVGWFEQQWDAYKTEEDNKIANELLDDYNSGILSEQDFNMAARDRKFQDFYRNTKVREQFKDIYDPKYRTWGEFWSGGPVNQGKGVIERNPIKSAEVLAGGIGGGEMARRSLKLGKEITQAENLVRKASGVVDKYDDAARTAHLEKFPYTRNKAFLDWVAKQSDEIKSKGAIKENYTKYQNAAFDDIVKEANKGQKAAKETLKALEDRRLIKRVGKQWVKLPGYAKSIGMIGGMLAIKPIVKGITGSEKAGEIAGTGVGTVIGGKMAFDATKKAVTRNMVKKMEKKGYKNVGENLSKIIAKRGWPWVLKRVSAKAPVLAAKILGKGVIGAVGSPFTAGGMAALMTIWSAADIYMLTKAIMDEA